MVEYTHVYDIGKNKLPVPPRSPESLKISEPPYEPMDVTPNRKQSGEFVFYTYCIV